MLARIHHKMEEGGERVCFRASCNAGSPHPGDRDRLLDDVSPPPPTIYKGNKEEQAGRANARVALLRRCSISRSLEGREWGVFAFFKGS